MSQPEWKLIAQLGDVNPIDHGGYFVYEDTTGAYPPEAEWLEAPDSDDAPEGWTAYRFPLERCTMQGRTSADGSEHWVSENEHHPECWAWFDEPRAMTCRLEYAAECTGCDVHELRDDLCSSDPIRLASAYRAIGEYHGFANLDPYPLTFTSRADVEARYAE